MINTKLSPRKNIRLNNYDYSQSGYYFVTICTQDKRNILGEIVINDSKFSSPIVNFSDLGKIVEQYINNIDVVYTNARLDGYVIMPNHIHLIIIIESNIQNPYNTAISLPQIIRSLKTLTNKKSGFSIWQRNYYEHVIRNEYDLSEIREYVKNNPLKWKLDRFFND